MKLKLSTMISMIIIFLIIMNLQLLNFGDFFQLYRSITAVVSIILGIICRMNKKIYGSISQYCTFFDNWIFIVFLFLFVEIIYGLMIGKYTIITYIGYIYIYFWLFLFYPIIYVMKSEGGPYRMIKRISIWCAVALIIKSFLWWLYNFKDIDIMHYLLFEYGSEWTREGYQRIPGACFSGILFAYCVFNLMYAEKKGKFCPIMGILLSFWYSIMVFASRAQLISFVVTICATLILGKHNTLKKLFIYITLGIGTIYITGTEYFNSFVTGLSAKTYSIGTRFREIDYYWNLFKEYPVLGFSFVLTNEEIQGSAGRFYMSDIGILERLFGLGIVGFIIFIYPLLRCSKCAMVNIGRKRQEEFPFAFSLICYTVVSSILSNNIYNFRLLFGLPFIVAYFEMTRIKEYG